MNICDFNANRKICDGGKFEVYIRIYSAEKDLKKYTRNIIKYSKLYTRNKYIGTIFYSLLVS